jgi:hypothetical protein
MKFSEIITEDLTNFREAGIPEEFAKNILRKFKISQDTEIDSLEGKPKASDIKDGNMIINVLPNKDVIAVLRRPDTGPTMGPSFYQRITLENGEFNIESTDSLKTATKGMTVKGSFYQISANNFYGVEREEPSGEEDSADPLAGGDEGIYNYMNDTFMPKMRAKMEKMVDDIYTKLRKLDKTKNRFGSQAAINQKNQQELAIQAAGAIEKIAQDGFSKSTMEEFLRAFGKLSMGLASIPRNERELRKLLKNEPNARAKWAQTVMKAAREQHKSVNDMYYQSTMKGLQGD